ncbi:MAG: cation diffusion facilitator family transporter [Rikenellaceae bacterium]|jgi:cation diffusion facilitator family transporter|nr:cation diffusion facilitator family transporter [Rikenellaceae bacterium]
MTEQKTAKERALIRTSWVSTVGNSVLAVAKIVVGLTAGSMAVLGDGIDSATDVVISIVMLVTAHIVSRPPSLKYVFGFEKAESIATKILSLVIFYAGVQMLVTSIGIMASGEVRALPGTLALWVTVFSIGGKLALALYQFAVGRKIASSLIIANAKNMRNDVLISVGVLLGLAFTYLLDLPILDAVTGLLISLFIIRTAIEIFIDSNIELMDGVKDEGVYQKIFDAVERVQGASNPHRVRSRLIGGMYMVDLDVEADGDITLSEAHEIAEQVEDSIREALENVYDIVVHIEPAGKHHDAEQFGIRPEPSTTGASSLTEAGVSPAGRCRKRKEVNERIN